MMISSKSQITQNVKSEKSKYFTGISVCKIE